VAALGVCFAAAAYAVTPSAEELEAAHSWSTAAFQPGGNLPFSFIYGGQQSAQLLQTWKREESTRRSSDETAVREIKFIDQDSGVEVRCLVKEYADFPAVEWVLHLKNGGTKDSPIFSNVLPLNTSFTEKSREASFGLRYALGSHERSDDFRPFETRTYSNAETMTFSSFGGRSSDGYLPFFNLLRQRGGVMLAIGWTGQWTASFRHSGSNAMGITAGMEFTHFKLLPGEEVRTPSILLEFWDGADATRGQNLFRSLVREHYSPRPSGKPLQVPVALSVHGTIGFEETTETNVIDAIGRAAAHGVRFDTWWIDTGWFELIGKNWARSVGNLEPDPARFPNGMRPIAEAAHANGMKFLLWFEPERVMRDTWLYNKHRSWLLSPPSNLPFEVSYMYYDGFYLFDFGNELARKWMTKYVSDSIDTMGIDIYRQDFNMFPLYYWRADERADRQGIREMKYIAGLYRFWDDLLAGHPGLLIDNCASGGRRIDIETLRRSVVLTRSDVIFRNPISAQCIGFGLSHWIPYHGMGAATIEPYAFRSGLGAACVFALNLNSSNGVWKQLNEYIREFDEFRHLYEGDFYPLTPYTLDSNQTLAWQYDRPDKRAGLVQVFRRSDCTAESMDLKLHALDRNRKYLVTNLDDPDEPRTVSGGELMSAGLHVDFPTKPCALLLLYRAQIEDAQAATAEPES